MPPSTNGYLTLPHKRGLSRSVRVRDPLVEVPGAYARAHSVAFVIVGTLLLAAAGSIPGMLAEDPWFRGFMLLFSLAMLTVLPGLIGIARVPARGTAIIATRGPLTFTASRFSDVFLFVSFALIGVAGIVGAMGAVQPGTYLSASIGRYSHWILIPVSAYAIFDQARRSRKPRGITVSPDGVSWQDLKRSGLVHWKDLVSVELGAYKRRKRLYLHDLDGELHVIEPSGMGSDPIVIAEAIAYFHAHPKHRDKLGDPTAALALFTEPA